MSDRIILRNHIEQTVQLSDEQFDYLFSFFKPLSFKKKQDWGSYVLQDGHLITGLNPASSEETSKQLLAVLAI